MTIAYIMPCMRAESALKVLEGLEQQTVKPDALLVVDNNGDFSFDQSKYSYEIQVFKTFKNIGTNAVWNMIYDLDYDYLGLVADDYVLPSLGIEIFLEALDLKFDDNPTALVSAKIISGRRYKEPKQNPYIIGKRIHKAKGYFGFLLGKKEMWHKLPPIPEELFVFFGDNWWSYWINRLGLAFVMLHNITILHWHKIDLQQKLGYKTIIEEERKVWRQWLRGVIELGGIRNEWDAKKNRGINKGE